MGDSKSDFTPRPTLPQEGYFYASDSVYLTYSKRFFKLLGVGVPPVRNRATGHSLAICQTLDGRLLARASRKLAKHPATAHQA